MPLWPFFQVFAQEVKKEAHSFGAVDWCRSCESRFAISVPSKCDQSLLWAVGYNIHATSRNQLLAVAAIPVQQNIQKQQVGRCICWHLLQHFVNALLARTSSATPIEHHCAPKLYRPRFMYWTYCILAVAILESTPKALANGFPLRLGHPQALAHTEICGPLKSYSILSDIPNFTKIPNSAYLCSHKYTHQMRIQTYYIHMHAWVLSRWLAKFILCLPFCADLILCKYPLWIPSNQSELG